MSAVLAYRYSLTWTNPYTAPPAGFAKCLAEIEKTTNNLSPDELQSLTSAYPHYQLGCGYGIHLDFVTAPPKKWSEETKRKARYTRNSNRIRKQYPLFADQFIAELEPPE